MLTNLLSLFTIIDDDASSKFLWVFAIALVALVGIFIVIAIFRKEFKTKTLAFSGLTIAASYVLSFLKFSPVTYGGSVTLASMLPICIFAYAFGLAPALLTGLVYGFLQFVQSPYIFNYATFFLDFLLAFSSIAMMAVARKIFKDKKFTPIIGLTFVYLLRFTFHFLSGLIYFENGGIWANIPQDNAFVYSFIYQIVYLLPDFAINFLVLFPCCITNKFNVLLKQMSK